MRTIIQQLSVLLFLTLGIVVGLYTFPVSAADQIKTSQFSITTSDIDITTATSSSFNLYLGDSVGTNPVKSAYATVSGEYTGGGTIMVKLDNNTASTKIFTLPNVSTPTYFALTYKDNVQIINPQSAGSYNYLFSLTPSGVTISDLDVLLIVTYRYAPASCPDGASTNEKIKTNEIIVTVSDAQISSATTTSFGLYIGDNLSGVSTPIKSAYFRVSGIYTGGGNIQLSLDNESLKIFTLPSVSSPTYFEFIYKDVDGIIAPVSAGTYTYTLGLTPTGVVISVLNVKLIESHRYKPPACSGTYPVTGEMYSAVFDTTGIANGPAYNSLLWKGVLGGPLTNQGKVRFQFAASECSNGASNYPTCTTGTWSFIGGGTCSSADWFDTVAPDTPVEIMGATCINQFNNKRYFRYATQICSNDCSTTGTYTPRVDDVVINWAP